MLGDIGFMILGFVILVGAGDALVRGAVALSLRIGMPAFVVSATVVAFGTSAPELLISVQAVMEQSAQIAIGNVVGSNIANVLLVLGIPALIAPIAGCKDTAHRNLYFMLAATAVFSGLCFANALVWQGGLVLVAMTLVMVVDSIRVGLRSGAAKDGGEELADLEDVDPHMERWKMLLLVGAGLIGLPLGAQFLVEGAQGLARSVGVSEAVIGLTIVAIGTSLPELATTVMAALRRQADVAIGSVIGSNIFNITAIIGIASFFGPMPVTQEILARDLPVMIGASLALVPFVLFCWPIGRVAGAVFLLAYILYIIAAYTPGA